MQKKLITTLNSCSALRANFPKHFWIWYYKHYELQQYSSEYTVEQLLGEKPMYMIWKLTILFPTLLVERISSLATQQRAWVFNSDMSLSQHVLALCRSCFFHVRDFHRIRRFVNKKTLTTLANVLVVSRCDYCNFVHIID